MSTTVSTNGTSRYANKKLSFFGAIRSEALKFRTLTTNWVMTLIIFALMVGFAVMGAFLVNSMYDSMQNMSEMAGASAEAGATASPGFSIESFTHTMGSVGIDMANMLVASVAVVFIASEYATRSIQTTMTVVPKRSMIFLTKFLVLSVFSFVLGFVSSVAGYFVAFQFLNSKVKDLYPFETGVLVSALGVAIYFMLVAWMGLGFGALLRNNAAGIMMVVTIFLILPIILSLFAMGFDWAQDAMKYLPSAMGRNMLEYKVADNAEFNNLQGGAFLALWCAVPALLGYLRMRFTDVK